MTNGLHRAVGEGGPASPRPGNPATPPTAPRPCATASWPCWRALATAALAVGGRYLVGRVERAPEAVDLIASLIDSALYLLSTTATVGGTTIALMMTLIGVARNADHEFTPDLYRG